MIWKSKQNKQKTCTEGSIIDLKKIDSVQLFLFTLKCCQKLKELKVENVRVKNIYFWGHTLTNFKSKSWNGKRTFQTTSKTIFTNLNSYFVIKLYALLFINQVKLKFTLQYVLSMEGVASSIGLNSMIINFELT